MSARLLKLSRSAPPSSTSRTTLGPSQALGTATCLHSSPHPLPRHGVVRNRNRNRRRLAPPLVRLSPRRRFLLLLTRHGLDQQRRRVHHLQGYDAPPDLAPLCRLEPPLGLPRPRPGHGRRPRGPRRLGHAVRPVSLLNTLLSTRQPTLTLMHPLPPTQVPPPAPRRPPLLLSHPALPPPGRLVPRLRLAL